MGPVRSASIVVPPSTVEGRRREGIDEDAFTLAVTAVELLAMASVPVPPGGPSITFDLFGSVSPGLASLFPLAVGRPGSPVALHPDRNEELERVLDTAPAAGEARVLVAAEALGDPLREPLEPRDAGAVALLLDPGPAPVRTPSSPGASASVELGAAGSALREAAARARGVSPVAWIPPSTPSTVAPERRRSEVSLRELSEGAYVPRPRYLDNLPSRWRFAAERCRDCSAITFPPRGRCRGCGSTAGLVPLELPRAGGMVEVATTVHAGAQPTEFDWWVDRVGAYDVALVEIAPGVRVTLQGTDAPAGTLRRGMVVGTVLRRLFPLEGEWRYGRKAVPLALTPGGSGSPAPTAP